MNILNLSADILLISMSNYPWGTDGSTWARKVGMTPLNPHSRVSLKSDHSALSFRYACALRAASYVQVL